jgi:hypothetical protein
VTAHVAWGGTAEPENGFDDFFGVTDSADRNLVSDVNFDEQESLDIK